MNKIRITSDVDALKAVGIPDEEAERLAGNIVDVANRHSGPQFIGMTLAYANEHSLLPRQEAVSWILSWATLCYEVIDI